MPLFSSTKRIRILPENEVDDLFARPDFNNDERLIWFELNQQEQSCLQGKRSFASKIDFMIQLGYFKSKHQFFNFTLNEVKGDVSYIIDRFYKDEKLTDIKVSRAQRHRNQQSILKLMQMTLFNPKNHIPFLLEKARSLSRVSNEPLFIFRALFDTLKTHKITIPAYTTFQEHIISVALHKENERLYSCLSLNMSLSEREYLLKLLDESEPFYVITCLKKQPKNFKLTSIRKEVENFEQLHPLYLMATHILPLLNLSKTAIYYYASLVEHYTVQGLTRINENQTCLWLLCFVYQRYRLMLDNVTTMLIYTCNQYKADVEEKAKALLVAELLKPNEQNWKIAKALRFYSDPKIDDSKAFSNIKTNVHTFFPPDKIDQVVNLLENSDAQKDFKDQFQWLAVDELAATYKQPLRLLIKALTFKGKQHQALQQAFVFLKGELNKGTRLSTITFEQFPLEFISSKDSPFIYNKDKKKIHINRFEYECYHRVAESLNQSSLFVTDSLRYSSLDDELVPNWSTQKTNTLNNLNNNFLNKGISHFIETCVKPLDQRIKDVNEAIQNGDNKFIRIKKDKDNSAYWTLPYTRKDKEINNPFYETLPKISITQLLRHVNDQTGFLNEFTHIKSHYSKSKMDEMSIIAALVANATNLGVDLMGTRCDLSQSDLRCADKNYIRLSTLRATNDRISYAISKLPIFKHWNLMDNLLLASADGQKTRTERETLLARFALKYFGLEKGVVSYSLIANHVPINCFLIGANMHESHFLFDLFYNNTSLIKPDVLSTDTEGANQLNFLFLHVIDKLFAPRYRSLSAKTESILSFGAPNQFSDYLIKPNRVFNEKLVRNEEENIQHIIASLLSGDANQYNIVRKLSSKGYECPTKHALWEMNMALMTEHLLTYIDDVCFRQSIQGGLCRGEAYHQLKRAIEKANGRNFRGTSDTQMSIWNECARLLANCVIYYNAVILNKLKEESDRMGDSERSQKLIRLSPVAWTHINFQGIYIFMGNDTSLDINDTTKALFNVNF